MPLTPKFRRAQSIVDGLGPADQRALDQICRDIRRVEVDLTASAAALMHRCIGVCAGLCCRNVNVDQIVSVDDLVFILAAAPEYREALASHLADESPLFASDCPLLADGVGPCILPDDVRPQICLASFCDDDGPIKREIQALEEAFDRLHRLIAYRRVRAAWRGAQRLLAGGKG